MLAEAGLVRDQCRITNVCQERPPMNDITKWLPITKKAQKELLDSGNGVLVGNRVMHPHVANGLTELQLEIDRVRPALIICLGNTPLWAVSGLDSVSKWRGSTLEHPSGAIVLPTFHPAAVLRVWKYRPTVVQDFRRAAYVLRMGLSKPKWNFLVRPSLSQVTEKLTHLLAEADRDSLLLSVDIETRGGHIACLGIAHTNTDALCIPFMCVEKAEGYWSGEDEAEIVWLLRSLLTHRNVSVVGQNFIFDAQYIYRHWHFIPNLVHDTMLAQHLCFPALPKALDYIASMYNVYYVYWKDDGKDWRGDADEDRYWKYNCEDCVRTLEAHHVLQGVIKSMNLSGPYAFQMRMWRPTLKMMIRGVRINEEQVKRLRKELTDYASHCKATINKMVGRDLNALSPKQVQEFLYGEMGLPVQKKRGSGSVTSDDEALGKLAKKEPLLYPLTTAIADFRTSVKLLDKLKPRLGFDNRMHSSFNIAGTKTFRMASSEDAFGSGMNLQNITKGDEDE